MPRSRNTPFVCAAVSALSLVVMARAQTGAPPGDGAPESVLFEKLPVVEAATLHAQTLQEAPASITIISAEDIRTYGFRTLGEALAAVRGFYVTYDRSYHYAGVRGFSIPGDYNTRFLVMLNGHNLTENVYSSNNFFGQDFDLDMDLVQRIEIVRGPSSALYGSNGIFATVNIVTKSPVDMNRLRFSTEAGSFGERKGMLSSSLPLGHGANLLVSASVFNNGGQSLYFPEFYRPSTNFGRAVNTDGERGYHGFANLIWRNWSFTGYLGAREKQVPTGWYGTVFDDPGNWILDARGFFEASYSRDLSATRKVRWRIYYDQYRYRARYDYLLGSPLQERQDFTAGDWVGSQLSYDFAIPNVGVLTVGGELNADIRAMQQNYVVFPEHSDILIADHPDISYGFFAQQQWRLSPAWNAYLGVRFDESKNHTAFLSPRAALVYQASAKSTYKFLIGHAFRNPNAYEMYYTDRLTQVGNLALRPEQADTFEISAERKLRQSLNGLVTVYHYQLRDLIAAETINTGWLQYRNGDRSAANGVELEVNGKPVEWLKTTASLALQHTTEMPEGTIPSNSPSRVAKLSGAIPVARKKLQAAASLEYLSTRRTVSFAQVPSLWLANLTLTTNHLHPDFDIQVGARNVFNRTYYDPVDPALPEDRVQGDGHAVFLKLIWRTRE